MEQAPPNQEKILAREEAARFITENQLLIQSLAGVRGVTIRVGDGFATSHETREVTVDPSFFIDKGYQPEWSTYGLLHELTAHLRGMVINPELAKVQDEFFQRGEERAVFLNVFEDIAGNRRMHQLLPSLEEVARDVYLNRQTKDADMTDFPRHLQFLYSLLRESMTQAGDTQIKDEVADAIEELRDWGRLRRQDAIEYVCNPNIASEKRWRVLQRVVWPVYERLVEQDVNEAQQNKGKPDNNNEQSGQGSSQAQAAGGQSPSSGHAGGSQSKEGTDETPGSGGRNRGKIERTAAGESFPDKYDEYWDTHPEILNEEQEKELKDFLNDLIDKGEAQPESDAGEGSSDSTSAARNRTSKTGKGGKKGAPADENAIKALEVLAGASYEVIQQYRSTLDRLWPTVEELEEFYKQIISDRLTVTYHTRRYQDEGSLNPDQIAEAYVATVVGRDEGAVYQEIQTGVERVPDSGGFDFYLLIDTSGSMDEEKARIAAESVMVVTEGLASCHQRVLEAQAEHGVELGLDVSTNVMVFNSSLRTLKPTGELLSEAERMTIYRETQKTGGGTGDYLALDKALKEIVAARQASVFHERKKIIIVVTDGDSGDSTRARKAVDSLRSENAVVIGVGIGSDSATRLYSPTGKRIHSVQDLPDTLLEIIKEQIRQGILKKKDV